jgi:hypothetical protein
MKKMKREKLYCNIIFKGFISKSPPTQCVSRIIIGIVGTALFVNMISALPVEAKYTPKVKKMIRYIDSFDILSDEEKMYLSIAVYKAIEYDVPVKEIKKIIKRSVHQHKDVIKLAEVIEMLAEAKEKRLPLQPLINKIKEGIAKKIPMKKIKTVLRKEIELLRRIQKLINYAINEGLIVKDKKRAVITIAEKIERGVPPEYIRELLMYAARNKYHIKRVEYITEKVACLVEEGIPVRKAHKIAIKMIEKRKKKIAAKLERKLERRRQIIEERKDRQEERLKDIEERKEERLRRKR